MKRLALVAVVLLSGAGAVAQAGQQPGQVVKDLYAAAAYEDALAAANRLRSDRPQREVEQYRVLSLVALGRAGEAQKAMEDLVSADPLYVMDPAETPPRVHEAFLKIRERLLPEVTTGLYLEARAALDQKDRAAAIDRFTRVLTIIDTAGPLAAPMGELRVLAAGFLDLSRALAEAAQASLPAQPTLPVETPAAPAESAPVPAVVTETPPRPLQQELPPWLPADSVTRKSVFNGAIRIRVGGDGRVEAAEIVRSVHPTYDARLLDAARDWLYEPARRNDRPVGAEITVEVNLRPPSGAS